MSKDTFMWKVPIKIEGFIKISGENYEDSKRDLLNQYLYDLWGSIEVLKATIGGKPAKTRIEP